VPSSQRAPPSGWFDSARSLVGSSRMRPLANTMFALASTVATLGGGSKVCELVPSGTRPMTSAASPTMLARIEVMGATVEAMLRRPSVMGVPAKHASLASLCTSVAEPPESVPLELAPSELVPSDEHAAPSSRMGSMRAAALVLVTVRVTVRIM